MLKIFFYRSRYVRRSNLSVVVGVDVVGAEGVRPIRPTVAQPQLPEVGAQIGDRVQELHRLDVVVSQRLGRVQHLKQICNFFW